MKHPSLAMASTIGLSCIILGSCNPQDPSAVRENQKMLAEATAKAGRLEQENISLKSQIEDLQKQVSATVAKAAAETNTKKGFTEDDLDKKLGATVGKLRDQLTAMDKKIDLLKTETEKSIALSEDRTRNPSVAANPAVARTNPNPPQPDKGRAAQPPQIKVQPAATPDPPKSKYDIKLDRPVMGPASHWGGCEAPDCQSSKRRFEAASHNPPSGFPAFRRVLLLIVEAAVLTVGVWFYRSHQRFGFRRIVTDPGGSGQWVQKELWKQDQFLSIMVGGGPDPAQCMAMWPVGRDGLGAPTFPSVVECKK